MVTYGKKYLFIMMIVFLLNSCDVDLIGLFGSDDLDKRWQAKNSPHSRLKTSEQFLTLDDEYSFIVLADTHIDGKSMQKLDKLKKIITDDDVKFAVFCGDITQSGKKEDIKIFFKDADSLGIPCYPVIGNHDIYFGNWPNWKELIGPTCYRISGDGTTLLILDSANAYFGTKQLDWLETELKKAKAANDRTFVFSHTNLFVKSLVDLQQLTDVRERARITSMLNGRCDIMFMGHVHRRVVNKVGNVPYITVEDYIGTTTVCQVWVTKEGVRYEFKKL